MITDVAIIRSVLAEDLSLNVTMSRLGLSKRQHPRLAGRFYIMDGKTEVLESATAGDVWDWLYETAGIPRPGSWVKIEESEVPSSIVFDVPRYRQGQIIEYAYGAHRDAKGDIGNERTAPYQRVTDQSEPPASRTTYYKRATR